LAGRYPRRIQWFYADLFKRYAILLLNLEQVHVRGLICRGLRLELVAALGIALAAPAMAAGPQAIGTATTLSAETRIQNGHTVAVLAVAVKTEDGLPATGAVVIEEDGRQLAGAALSAEGRSRVELAIPTGEHKLTAVYTGDATHQASASSSSGVRAEAVSAPSFQISVAPGSLSLTAGQSGSVTVSVSPVNASALTAPMFVTLSCSGFPDQSSCSFTPENVEILPNASTAITSSMVLTTQAKSLVGQAEPPRANGNPVAWAVLLPGTLGLAGLAFGARRRWLSRLALMGLVGLVAALGATACAPRYNYYNHGPPFNLPTPSGSYTLQITAQSSNGITATTQSIPFALTVK
jgi:Bacterial Ig-like domain (group 3)